MVRDFFDAYDEYSDREAGTTTYVDDNDNEISEEEALRKMVGIEVKKATDELKATMNVQGLTAKGDKVTATYTILNNSEDLSAKLSATTTNDNETYFTVTQKIADPTTITAGNTSTIEVTVELIKTPVTADETATIGVEITAEPQQP